MLLIPKSQQHRDLCPCSISYSKTKQSKWPIYFVLLFFACGDAFLLLVLHVGRHTAYCMASQRRRKEKKRKSEMECCDGETRFLFSLCYLWVMWELVKKLSSEMAPYQITGLYCAPNIQVWASNIPKSWGPQLLSFMSFLSFDIETQQHSRSTFKLNWVSQDAKGKRQA